MSPFVTKASRSSRFILAGGLPFKGSSKSPTGPPPLSDPISTSPDSIATCIHSSGSWRVLFPGTYLLGTNGSRYSGCLNTRTLSQFIFFDRPLGRTGGTVVVEELGESAKTLPDGATFGVSAGSHGSRDIVRPLGALQKPGHFNVSGFVFVFLGARKTPHYWSSRMFNEVYFLRGHLYPFRGLYDGGDRCRPIRAGLCDANLVVRA